MKSSFLVGFFALVLASSTAFAEQQTLTFQEGDGGLYSATQATFIAYVGTANYGSDPSLVVSVDLVIADFTPGDRALVRFPDMIGSNTGQIPSGSTILSASLQLTRSTTSTNAVSLHLVTDTWDEATVNGDTSPGFLYPESVGSIPAGGAGAKIVNVTGAVQAWSSGTPNWGFVITSGYSPITFSESFDSDDAAIASNRPLLSVTFTPPPLSPVEQSTWGKVKALYR